MPGPEVAVGSGGVDVGFSVRDNVGLSAGEGAGFSEGDVGSDVGGSLNHSSIN